jgi:putative phage-type endonuclease
VSTEVVDPLHIEALRNVYQPEQRTSEWYQFRHDHITASNAWKALGTDSAKNQLIYEKCKPLNIERYAPSLTETPMSWGHKYEPLTVKLYELFNDTTISDFGCIPHPSLGFLAASPDGIVTGTNNFGRMIEIKNVVSRDITGIPKKDYYIQMQIQMEVCNLNECDFVETKFVEFDSEQQYLEDKSDKRKGVIVVFIRDNAFFHCYMPFETVDIYEWMDSVMNQHQDLQWYRNIYWCLEVYSCVLVRRQPNWFSKIVPSLQEMWDTIMKERESGYDHRAPKKRARDTTVAPTNCLVKLI